MKNLFFLMLTLATFANIQAQKVTFKVPESDTFIQESKGYIWIALKSPNENSIINFESTVENVDDSVEKMGYIVFAANYQLADSTFLENRKDKILSEIKESNEKIKAASKKEKEFLRLLEKKEKIKNDQKGKKNKKNED